LAIDCGEKKMIEEFVGQIGDMFTLLFIIIGALFAGVLVFFVAKEINKDE
jgi:hypothetical protein